MTTPKQLNNNGQNLRHQLAAAKSAGKVERKGDVINVAGVGQLVSAAYEQLRNAAEYTQEHLLLQKAIRRFYARSVPFHSHKPIGKSIAEELVVELTQAGYLENDSQPVEVVNDLTDLIQRHYENYWQLKQASTPEGVAQDWTLDLLSVASEKCVGGDSKQAIYAQFAFRHYLATLPKESFIEGAGEEQSYEASLYVAVHRALLKSDLANVRYDMQQLYQVSDTDVATYKAFHENIDKIFLASMTDRMTRHINKYGAPLRVLKGMIDDKANLDELLLDSRRFKAAYEERIMKEYKEAKRKVNKGVIKSIVFLFITKVIVGLAIEIPYDLLVAGTILVMPLVVNLLVPVVYMALLRASLKMPGKANTQALKAYAENMLYGQDGSDTLYPIPKKASGSLKASLAYGLMFVVAFGIVINQLIVWDFNLVQGGIFFVFLATASFLGFRLSRIVRELELVVAKPGIVSILRDFLYLPFIKLGQWLSEKYQRVNIVALILDTLIEVPLKTVLRLVRQWAGFINEKKDEI